MENLERWVANKSLKYSTTDPGSERIGEWKSNTIQIQSALYESLQILHNPSVHSPDPTYLLESKLGRMALKK